jgi:hypothetical protein
LDVARRRKVFQNKQAEIIRLMDRDGAAPGKRFSQKTKLTTIICD